MGTLRQDLTPLDRLRTNLAAQTAAAEEMERLLEREHERIGSRDWPAVQGLSADKNQLAQRLQSLMRELLALTGDAPGARMAAMGLTAEWTALMERARRLQSSNRESRVLLDRHHARASAALQVLNRGNAAPTYGRYGMAGFGGLRQKLAAA